MTQGGGGGPRTWAGGSTGAWLAPAGDACRYYSMVAEHPPTPLACACRTPAPTQLPHPRCPRCADLSWHSVFKRCVDDGSLNYGQACTAGRQCRDDGDVDPKFKRLLVCDPATKKCACKTGAPHAPGASVDSHTVVVRPPPAPPCRHRQRVLRRCACAAGRLPAPWLRAPRPSQSAQRGQIRRGVLPWGWQPVLAAQPGVQCHHHDLRLQGRQGAGRRWGAAVWLVAAPPTRRQVGAVLASGCCAALAATSASQCDSPRPRSPPPRAGTAYCQSEGCKPASELYAVGSRSPGWGCCRDQDCTTSKCRDNQCACPGDSCQPTSGTLLPACACPRQSQPALPCSHWQPSRSCTLPRVSLRPAGTLAANQPCCSSL